MKRTRQAICLSAILAFCGCQYSVPLVPEATVAIDAALLGTWEPVAAEGKEADDGNMLILRFSEREYMVIYPTGKDAMYYRAYPVSVGGMPLVQIQWLGYEGHPLKSDEKPYHVCRYKVEGDSLTIQTLNADVVRSEIATSQELTDALLNNAANPELFHEPGRFKRSAN
ncbi:MAG: hypothetical protein JXB04_13565 [Kiritimatiellae bacterium]|nr:hypothetical protein [Kiritimatiellia bacterium]